MQKYRVIALISFDIVPSLDIEGRELAGVQDIQTRDNIRRYQCDNPFIIIYIAIYINILSDFSLAS